MVYLDKKNFRNPPNSTNFSEIFHFFWNHGVGNELNSSGDPVPWDDESLEFAFDTIKRPIDRRTIQNWRSGQNLPGRRNLHALAKIAGGQNLNLTKEWADVLISARFHSNNQKAQAEKSPKNHENLENSQSSPTSMTTKVGDKILTRRVVWGTLATIFFLGVVSLGLREFTDSKIINVPAIAEIEKSIAVMPFKTISDGQDIEYLSTGISEEIIHALVQRPDLRVIPSRISLAAKNATIDPDILTEELNANYILEGSINKIGDRWRISSTLTYGKNDHVWSKDFETTLRNVVDIQEYVAKNVAQILEVSLDPNKPNEMVSTGTSDIQAYDRYLKARHILKNWHDSRSQNDIWEAARYFKEAREYDDKMAKAWLHSTDIYYHFAAGHISAPDDLKGAVIPTSRLDAKRRIANLLGEAEDHALTNELVVQARMNMIFFSDNWTNLRHNTQEYAKLSSRERGELEWLFGPVILLLLQENSALQNLIENRVLRFDPKNGTGHAYAVRQFLLANDLDEAQERLKRAEAETFSNRLDEVRGYILFAKRDAVALRDHVSNSRRLTPVLKDYFEAMALYLEGNSDAALTQLQQSEPLQREGFHRAIGLNHIGQTALSKKQLEKLIEEPIGIQLLSVALSYGAGCGNTPLPPLKKFDEIMKGANASTLPCIGSKPDF